MSSAARTGCCTVATGTWYRSIAVAFSTPYPYRTGTGYNTVQHLFTFYFACLGAITPPVCAAVYVPSSLADSNWWKTGWLAVRLGLALLLQTLLLAWFSADYRLLNLHWPAVAFPG